MMRREGNTDEKLVKCDNPDKKFSNVLPPRKREKISTPVTKKIAYEMLKRLHSSLIEEERNEIKYKTKTKEQKKITALRLDRHQKSSNSVLNNSLGERSIGSSS